MNSKIDVKIHFNVKKFIFNQSKIIEPCKFIKTILVIANKNNMGFECSSKIFFWIKSIEESDSTNTKKKDKTELINYGDPRKMSLDDIAEMSNLENSYDLTNLEIKVLLATVKLQEKKSKSRMKRIERVRNFTLKQKEIELKLKNNTSQKPFQTITKSKFYQNQTKQVLLPMNEYFIYQNT